MTDTTASTLQIYTIYIEATAEQEWQAITDSAYTTRWGYGGAVEYDLTPGGSYRNLSTPAMREMGLGDVAVSGQVIEVVPHRLLRLTWSPAWRPDAEPTLVTWELTPFQNGLTKVTLTHDCTADPDLAAEVAGGGEPMEGGGGWTWALSGLKTLLESGRTMGPQEP